MGGECGVHCRADNSEVVLLLQHEFFQCLHGRLLLASLGVHQALWVVVSSSSCLVLRCVDRRVRTALLLSETEVNKINEMRLIRVVSNHNIGRLEVPMNIALRMNTLQPIHKLQRNNDHGLYLELALLKRLLQLLQVNAEQLHHQVVIVLVRAVRVKSRKANPAILRNGRDRSGGALLLLLLLLQLGIKLNGFRVLVLDTVFLQRLLLRELHHVLHQRYFPLKLRLVFA